MFFVITPCSANGILILRKSEREMLDAYLLNFGTFLQDDLTELQNRVRFRKIDSVDLLEMTIALERLRAFQEFSKNVRAILHMCDVENSKSDDTKK